MKNSYLYYCFALALLVTGLYQIFMPANGYIAEQLIKPGQIAEKDIIAPVEFPLLKSEQRLKEERASIIRMIKPVYLLSDEIQFEAIKLIDALFTVKNDKSAADTTYIQSGFQQHGIYLTSKSLQYLSQSANRKALYMYLLDAVDQVYQTGVYENIESDSIVIYVLGEAKSYRTSQLLSVQSAIEQVGNKTHVSGIRHCLTDILPALIKPNVIKDQKRYEELVAEASASVPVTEGAVAKNEIIVRQNTRITEEDVNKIKSLVSALQQKDYRFGTWKSLSVSISFFLYFFALGLMLYAFCYLFYPQILESRYHFIPIISGLAINAILAIVNNQLLGLQTLLIPYSLTIITAAIILDTPFAIFFNFLSFASIYPFVNWETFSPLVLVLATLSVLLLLSRLGDKHQYLTIWFYLVITTSLLTLIFALYKNDSLMVLAVNMGYAFISATLSVIFMLFVVPYIENKWNLATKQRLLELLDFNHPLLKRLATEAVGTYHHSLVVGNLAERTAEAIGANPLLARVGSYYHDIGKIHKPVIYTENNPDSALIHDALQPFESAGMIKNHVTEGILLAKKYRIPEPIIEIIAQHHGTGYIKYFLDKAEKSRISINLDEYKYAGPRPQSKEAALVMIADIVESITKSWTDISVADIRRILDDTIYRLIREGQFDESAITMQDLVQVKSCMIPVLESIYRKRIQYPENKNDDGQHQ